MVKTKAVNPEVLAQENELLRAKIAELEANKPDMVNVFGDRFANEIKKITKAGKSSAGKIDVVEKHDHKNISLWTKWGSRIGPLHPDNAIKALSMYAGIGIVLSVDRPTDEQVEAYKKTPEWIAYKDKEDKRRAIKDKSKRVGQMDRLTEAIAKMAGVKPEEVNRIVKPS